MADETTTAEKSDLLYEECAKVVLNSEEKFRKQFNQDDLLNLCKNADDLAKIISVEGLMPLVSKLSALNFFLSLKQKGGALCWTLRPRDAAKAMQKLNNEEKMVYVMVEESNTTGVWHRNIKKRSNLTDQGIAKVVDKLMKLRLIKPIKNIKNPAQKTYMLFHLVPSDDVTGGSFYDGGELDENLVTELGNLIVFHVRQASWVDEKRRKIKHDPSEPITIADDDQTRSVSPQETRGRKKRKTSHAADIEDAGPAKKSSKHDTHSYTHVQLSHPPHHEYPDAQSIHRFITHNNFIRAAKAEALTVDEVQNILNVLVWDNKLEPVNGGYRTVRGVKPPTMSGEQNDSEDEDDGGGVLGKRKADDPERRGNGLTEMPCGRCPVIEICGTGGPVNASTCVYFERWLGLAVDGQGAVDRGRGMEVEIVG